MYTIIPQQIPQGMRAEVNEKILFAIDSGKNLIPAESIYNCYTGIGGLHNLKQSDFASYHEYAEAKKEFEMGQFFTPHEICRDMVDMLCPVSSEMVLDMCCGMGNFFNHLPNPHNAYGFDIDGKAVSVARYLYPEAHIEKCDIRQYCMMTITGCGAMGNGAKNVAFRSFSVLRRSSHKRCRAGGSRAVLKQRNKSQG